MDIFVRCALYAIVRRKLPDRCCILHIAFRCYSHTMTAV